VALETFIRACMVIFGAWLAFRVRSRAGEDALTRAIITLADRFGRYGNRCITIKYVEPAGM
jgi:hypothetical protein